MASLNRVTMIGNVGSDPEIGNGDRYAKFPLATKEYIKEERKTITDWHNIILMGYLVDTAKEYITKGSTIYLEGRLKTKVTGDIRETYVLWDRLELLARGNQR